MLMTPKQILRAAIERLEQPGAWGQGRRYYDRPQATCCIAEAIEETAPCDLWAERRQAMRLIYCAAGLEFGHASIAEWNDAPERTLNDVLRTVRLATAIAL